MSANHSHSITPMRDVLKQLYTLIDTEGTALRLSIRMLIVTAIAQGIALGTTVPLINAVITQRDPAAAWLWFAIFIGFSAVALTARWIAMRFDYNGYLVQATHRMRLDLGMALRKIPLAVLRRKRTGELAQTVLANVDENLMYTITIGYLIISSVLTPLAAAGVVLCFDWRLGLAFLAVFPLILPFYRWRRPAIGRGMRYVDEAHAQTHADILEFTQGLSTLRASCGTQDGIAHVSKSFQKLEDMQSYGHRKGRWPNMIIATAIEMGLMLVLVLGAWLVTGSGLDAATFAAVVLIASRVAEPLGMFVVYASTIEIAENGIAKLIALLREPTLAVIDGKERDGVGVTFENVSFTYEGAARGMEDVNLTFDEGAMTAIVGPSGSGKTTLTRLIARQADPQQGRITIGGADLRSFDPEALNELISVVFQEVYLFDDTIAANLRMVRPEATDTELEAAARSAGCWELIESLPQGWNTRIGEIGSRLSGGERQRISIARALLKDAPIVILDEPTAALDAQSELIVQQAIDVLVQGRTVIVIAHRLSTIARADKIVVIDEGRVVEQGRHDELRAQNGRYSRMWAAQESTKSWRAEQG